MPQMSQARVIKSKSTSTRHRARQNEVTTRAKIAAIEFEGVKDIDPEDFGQEWNQARGFRARVAAVLLKMSDTELETQLGGGDQRSLMRSWICMTTSAARSSICKSTARCSRRCACECSVSRIGALPICRGQPRREVRHELRKALRDPAGGDHRAFSSRFSNGAEATIRPCFAWRIRMKTRVLGLLLGLSVATLASHPAAATDQIPTGQLAGITSREGYLMFIVRTNAGINVCAACPPDPGHLSAGGFCWVADSDATKITMLLNAKDRGSRVSGRVESLTSDCTMYQLQLPD
jgi:hypothetical protein